MEYIEIPLTGKHGRGKFTLVDGDYDGEYFSQFKWYFNPRIGYVYRRNFETQTGIIYLHHEVLKSTNGLWRDHINRNKLDNRSCNLRLVTVQQNAFNRPQMQKPPKAGYRGVYKYRNKWIACCSRYIGSFSSALEAAQAYDKDAKKRYGIDAITNFT